MRISRGYHRAPVPTGPENSFLQMGQLCQFYQTFPFHGILSFRNLDSLDPLEVFFKTITRPVQPKVQKRHKKLNSEPTPSPDVSNQQKSSII